jgi:NADH-quinone oxidoreductase subunit M
MLGIAAAAAAWGDAGLSDAAAMASNGAALQMFNHGIITGGLFFLVGVIYERAHTRDLQSFGGLSKMTPYYYGIFMVTALASLGLPGLAGFWAEFFVFRGAFQIMPVFAAIGVAGIVVTAAYILWKEVTHGAKLTDLLAFEKVTMWPLVLFMIGFGVYPTPIVDFFNNFSKALFGR